MAKMTDFSRSQKLGEGKRNPWTGEVWGWGEKSREEPQILSEPRGQHLFSVLILTSVRHLSQVSFGTRQPSFPNP